MGDDAPYGGVGAAWPFSASKNLVVAKFALKHVFLSVFFKESISGDLLSVMISEVDEKTIWKKSFERSEIRRSSVVGLSASTLSYDK